MTECTKTILSLILAGTTLLLTAFLWESPILLVVLLACVSLGMLFVENAKNAVFIYFAGFLLGPLSESIVIYFGAWTYTEPHLLGFAMWLPFVWGNASLFIIRLGSFIEFLGRVEKKHLGPLKIFSPTFMNKKVLKMYNIRMPGIKNLTPHIDEKNGGFSKPSSTKRITETDMRRATSLIAKNRELLRSGKEEK